MSANPTRITRQRPRSNPISSLSRQLSRATDAAVEPLERIDQLIATASAAATSEQVGRAVVAAIRSLGYLVFFAHVLRVFAGDVRKWIARVSYELNECKLEDTDESLCAPGESGETAAGEYDTRSLGSGFENLNFELESCRSDVREL